MTEFSTVEFAGSLIYRGSWTVSETILQVLENTLLRDREEGAGSPGRQAYHEWLAYRPRESDQTWSTIRHPRAWLRTVAVREYHRVRTLEAEVLTDSLPEGMVPAADDGLEDRARARAALAAFSQLPPRQREVMSWCRDEFTPAEIARELGIDAAAVRQSIAKARRNLRKLTSTWRNT